METKAPSVSVLMPAYNAEKYIKDAIESILNQTFKDFEFIIIDDCSTDNTWKVIQDYAKKDLRIRVFHNEYNLYISKTRNLLLQYAKSEIIAIMDADDIAMSTRLEKQYNFLINNEGVAVVGGFLEIMDEFGKTLNVRKYLEKDEDLKKKIFRYSPIAQPVAMYRKKIIIENGGYVDTAAPAEDLRLWLKLGVKYKFANIPEVLLKYRFYLNSSSNIKLRKVEVKTLKMRWYFYKMNGYKPNLLDWVYNILQALTIYIMPVKLRIWLFDLIRMYI